MTRSPLGRRPRLQLLGKSSSSQRSGASRSRWVPVKRVVLAALDRRGTAPTVASSAIASIGDQARTARAGVDRPASRPAAASSSGPSIRAGRHLSGDGVRRRALSRRRRRVGVGRAASHGGPALARTVASTSAGDRVHELLLARRRLARRAAAARARRRGGGRRDRPRIRAGTPRRGARCRRSAGWWPIETAGRVPERRARVDPVRRDGRASDGNGQVRGREAEACRRARHRRRRPPSSSTGRPRRVAAPAHVAFAEQPPDLARGDARHRRHAPDHVEAQVDSSSPWSPRRWRPKRKKVLAGHDHGRIEPAHVALDELLRLGAAGGART